MTAAALPEDVKTALKALAYELDKKSYCGSMNKAKMLEYAEACGDKAGEYMDDIKFAFDCRKRANEYMDMTDEQFKERAKKEREIDPDFTDDRCHEAAKARGDSRDILAELSVKAKVALGLNPRVKLYNIRDAVLKALPPTPLR